jgi:hypothetical protein
LTGTIGDNGPFSGGGGGSVVDVVVVVVGGTEVEVGGTVVVNSIQVTGGDPIPRSIWVQPVVAVKKKTAAATPTTAATGLNRMGSRNGRFGITICEG